MKEHFVVLVTTAPSLHASTRELATRLARRANAVLMFLHVVPLPLSDGEAMLHTAAELLHGEHEAWLAAQAPADAQVRYRHRLLAGEPEQLVARFVEEHDVDLVVAEEPPRFWLSAALWRGMAERLVRQVSCPVVIGGPAFLQTTAVQPAPVAAGLAHTQVLELLHAMVQARVDALRCWMDHAADSVRRVAATATVERVVSSVVGSRGRLDARTERMLRVELDEHRRALHAQGWQLSVGGSTWASQGLHAPSGPALAAFLRRVDELGCSTSLPVASDEALDRLVVVAGAKVAHGEGILWMVFDAEADFLRILGQPGPLPSFETYAFDESGLMLSNSRFPDHLLSAGLLPEEGQQTPLRLRVAEPQEAPMERWPLTLMAQQATQHRDGFNTRGYRDYRGTPVVGAWRWVPEYDFGVTAEVDRAVAYG